MQSRRCLSDLKAPTIMYKDCPNVFLLPAVIEHRETCLWCEAMNSPTRTAEWIAAELCRGNNVQFDETVIEFVHGDPIRAAWTGNLDEETKKKAFITHLGQYFSGRAP